MDRETLKGIHDLNLSSLLLAKKVIDQDKSVAMYRFGIDEEMIEVLGKLTLAQMLKLSETNQLLFQFRFDDQNTVKKLITESRIDDMKQMHTSILLSSLLFDSIDK